MKKFLENNGLDLGALLLRVLIGSTFLAHAGLKFFVFGLDGTAQFFQSLGLPAIVAYLTIVAESLGGLTLILGFKTRIVSIVLSTVLLGAIIFVHWNNGFWFSNKDGGFEYPLFWMITLYVQALIGSGKYKI